MRSYENEPIVVQRQVKAVAIPAGVEVNLKLGSVGYITQALGGSFTVYIDGNLFRVAGQDADAIGKTAATAPEVPPGASEQDIKNVVWQQLKTCYDPEIPVNIVDLGLVYECEVSKNEDATRTVDIKMTLTAPALLVGHLAEHEIRIAIAQVDRQRLVLGRKARQIPAQGLESQHPLPLLRSH